MLLVAGRKTNLFAEGLSLVASSENPRLPASNLGNSDPALPAASAVATSPWDLTLDGRLKEFPDPHFDGAWSGAPSGWSVVGDGTLTRDTVVTSSGSGASCKFDSTLGPKMVYVRGQVACGAVLDLSARFRSSDGVQSPSVYVLCEDTGLYYSGEAGAWIAGETPALFLADPLTTTWELVQALAIQIPNLTDSDVVNLRISLGEAFGSGATVWVDDLQVLSRVSLLTAHHPRNVQGATLALQTSADGVVYNDLATIAGTTARFESWVSFTAQSSRWWRLRVRNPKPLDHVLPTPWGFEGPPAIGEAVLALARSFAGTWRKAEDGYDVPQARVGQAGRYRQAQAGGPYRKVTLQRMGATGADWALVLNRLYLASLGGVRNSVLVWDESAPSRVVLGAIEAGLQLPFDVTEPNVPHTLTITGYAPPVWTS